MHGEKSKIQVKAHGSIFSNAYDQLLGTSGKFRQFGHAKRIQILLENMECLGCTFADDGMRFYYFENEDKRLRFILEYT